MGELSESHKLNMRQMAVHRRNLIDVCRLAVKSLIDKSCFETIDDECDQLVNLVAIIEQILSHRLKPRISWYGTEDQRPFWEFIQAACRRVPHNCIANIESMENILSARAKGRAWLRVALMEKRLSEYISTALQQEKVIRAFFEEGAIMLCEEADMLSGLLLGLNTIDFNFCLKGENLELAAYPIIDYTPYLKYQQSPESLESDAQELQTLNVRGQESNPNFSSNLDDLTWKTKYLSLESKYRTLCQQKSYMEELARLREAQLQESERLRHKLLDNLQQKNEEHTRDRHQLETIILELQNQLATIKAQQEVDCQNMEDYLTQHYMDVQSRNSGAAAAAFVLRELHRSKSAEETSSSSWVQKFRRHLTKKSVSYCSFLEDFGRKSFRQNQQRMMAPQRVGLEAPDSKKGDHKIASQGLRADPQRTMQADTKSIISSTFSTSQLEDSGSSRSSAPFSKGWEDSLSMKPLAGSFSSESSLLVTEGHIVKNIDLTSSSES